MKVEIDGDVFDVKYVDTEKMKVSYVESNTFRRSVKLSECKLMPENKEDDLTISHVKNVMSRNFGDIRITLDGETHTIYPCDSLKAVDDVVNKPKHYQIGLGDYEMKDVSYALIDHNKLGGREGAMYFNVMKYIGRFNNKGVPVQDLEKAEFYLKELIKLTKEKDY